MFLLPGCDAPIRTAASALPGLSEGAGLAQLVERRLAKAKVAGSRPVSRSRPLKGSPLAQPSL